MRAETTAALAGRSQVARVDTLWRSFARALLSDVRDVHADAWSASGAHTPGPMVGERRQRLGFPGVVPPNEARAARGVVRQSR